MSEQVTVIIPAWNANRFLRRAIESAVDQTRQPEMIVVADDGSTDGTFEMATALGNGMSDVGPGLLMGTIQNVRYAVIRKPHVNLPNTRNVGMRFAMDLTSVFGFLDADDWYAPQKIQRSLEAFALAPQIACVVSDYDDVLPDGKTIRRYKSPFDANRLMMSCLHNINCFVRRDALAVAGLFDESLTYCEDYDLFLRLSEIGLIYHIPEVLHHRSEHGTNMSGNLDEMFRHEAMVKQKAAQRRGAA